VSWAFRFDIGEFGHPEGSRDLANAGDVWRTSRFDATQQGEGVAQERIGRDEAAHRVHDDLDLLIRPGDVGYDGGGDRGRGEAGDLSVQVLYPRGFQSVAAADQVTKAAQMRGWRCPGRRGVGGAGQGSACAAGGKPVEGRQKRAVRAASSLSVLLRASSRPRL